jgi:hypothetical protein
MNASTPSQNQLFNLRQVVAAELAVLPTPALVRHFDGLYGEGAAEAYDEYLEGIFDDIGKTLSRAVNTVADVAKKAAPVVAKVGGGALQGALAGSALGLPGIIGGAVLGGAGAGLSAYGKGTARDIGGVLSGVTNLAGQFSPAGKAGGALGSVIGGLAGGGGKGAAGAAVNALGGLLGGGGGQLGALAGGAGSLGALGSLFGGSGAGGQLISLLQRPETMHALAALNLGSAGRSSVRVGAAQTPIPVGAIANLIGTLAQQAAAEAAAGDGEAEPAYMIGESGDYMGDPASPRDRAAAVWNALNNAQAERVVEAFHQARAAPAGRRQYEAVGDWGPGEALFDAEMDMVELSEAVDESFEEDFAEGVEEWEEDYETV